MDNKIYTIGYAGFDREEFVKELKQFGISVLVDVRSSPFSSFHPEYNKDVLSELLKNNGIYYRNYATEFGARQENSEYYDSNGRLSFEKFAQSSVFKSGVTKLCNSIKQGYKPVLMCAEKNPFDCHRAILVSRAFFERGCDVVHILPDGKTCSQEDINTELLEKYCPNRFQVSMFDNPDEKTLLEEAYRKRGSEIAFCLAEEETQ